MDFWESGGTQHQGRDNRRVCLGQIWLGKEKKKKGSKWKLKNLLFWFSHIIQSFHAGLNSAIIVTMVDIACDDFYVQVLEGWAWTASAGDGYENEMTITTFASFHLFLGV